MRVLHLTRDFPPGASGGVSVASRALVTALDGAAISTGVVSFDRWRGRDEGEDIEEGEHGVLLRVRKGRPFEAVEAAARRLRPTVLHLHHENLLPFAHLLREALDCPLVYTVHTLQGPDLRGGAPSLSSFDQARALESADVVTVPSQFAAAEVATLVRNPAAAQVVPNIVAEATARPRRDPRRTPIASYVGRFDYAKGTDLLFEVVARALAAQPTLRFEIAGGLPASIKRERRWRRRWHTTAAADVAHRVRFRGWLEGEALHDLYARSAIQVVPSRRETFGLSAAEAMARGLAVVATRCGGLTELIDDGVTGVLCDGPAELADRLVQLVREPERGRALGRRAAEVVAARYRPAVVLPQWIDIYERAGRVSRAAPCCE